jgi:hypothetical protein
MNMSWRSVIARLRPAKKLSEKQGQRTCATCVYFVSSPRTLEGLVPGFASLSSAQASVRRDDGLCLWHDRLCGRSFSCGDFEAYAPAPGGAQRLQPRHELFGAGRSDSVPGAADSCADPPLTQSICRAGVVANPVLDSLLG